jgi:hypothetical protein
VLFRVLPDGFPFCRDGRHSCLRVTVVLATEK